MHPDLERLAHAAKVDRERRDLAAERDAARESVRQATRAVDAALALHAERDAALASARETERALNRKLHLYRDRRASALRVLEHGAGDPSAAERQLSQCDEILDATETEVLELFEAQDTLQRQLEEARSSLDHARADLARAGEGLEERVSLLTQAIDALDAERRVTLAGLDAPTRDRYEQLVARKGTAVAVIEGDACKACRMVIQPQHRVDLERGLIVPCRGCHRWLVP